MFTLFLLGSIELFYADFQVKNITINDPLTTTDFMKKATIGQVRYSLKSGLTDINDLCMNRTIEDFTTLIFEMNLIVGHCTCCCFPWFCQNKMQASFQFNLNK